MTTSSEPTVERFLPRFAAPADLAAWCEVFSDGQRELAGGSPTAAVLAERLAAEEKPVMRWAARGAGSGIVSGVAELRPQEHEPGAGFLRLFVARPARRHGLGSRLLAQVVHDAAASGTERLRATTPAGLPGEPFARTWPDLRVLLRLQRQDQRLDREGVLDRCRELAACPDPAYRLEHWNGPAPERLASSFGRVMGHVLDAPGAAEQLAHRAWDMAAVRSWEAEMGADGNHLVVCSAVHQDSGECVAATVLTVPPSGGPAADQHDTAVLPDHRGRGLARWIKAEQTLRLHRRFPRVRCVSVTVNRQNLPMTAVNRAVGYLPVHDRLLVEMLLRISPAREVPAG